MARYGALHVLIYRYPKGMRTIGAIPVGLGEMPWIMFTCLNPTSAALWTNILVLGGYSFGDLISSSSERGWLFLSILFLAVF